jgi:glycosyltransferase involved in cell wall biosynthesis
MRILAIIPAYNEQDCIKATVDNLVATCPGVDYLVVNDGSSDGTAKILDEGGYNHVDLPVNTGLASGFKCGMKYAERHDYDAALQFDADGQHLPEFIPKMAKAMEGEGANIVIASRVKAGDKVEGLRGLGSRLIAALIKLTTGTTIADPPSGMRMYDREMIKIYAHGFDLTPEPDAVAFFARKGYKITEVGAHMQERQGGTSYLDAPNVVRYMSRTCLSILMFQWFR